MQLIQTLDKFIISTNNQIYHNVRQYPNYPYLRLFHFFLFMCCFESTLFSYLLFLIGYLVIVNVVVTHNIIIQGNVQYGNHYRKDGHQLLTEIHNKPIIYMPPRDEQL